MDIAKQLTQLRDLHESGALTDDEFGEAKRRLLASSSGPLPDTPTGTNSAADTSANTADNSAVDQADVPPAPSSATTPPIGTTASQIYKIIHRARGPLTHGEIAQGASTTKLDSAIAELVRRELIAGRRIDRSGVEVTAYVVRPGAPPPGRRTAKVPGGRPGSSPDSILHHKLGAASSGSPPPTKDEPRLGGWTFAVLLLGFIGGAIGYFSLKDTAPRRASHVMKWGLIWTVIGWIALAFLAGFLGAMA